MAGLSAALAGFLLLFALAGNLWLSVSAVIAIGVVRGLIWPLYIAWVNHRLDSSVRATVLSMSGQVDSIGQIASGPLLGVVARNLWDSHRLNWFGVIAFTGAAAAVAAA